MKRPGAYACQKNHQIEVAAKQALGELERLRIVLNRSLAHRRRDKRIATLFADQLGHFLGAPALERDHAETVEGHQSAFCFACSFSYCFNTRLTY
jgi:hypothetical protein